MITQLVGILLVLLGGVIIGYVIARITSNGTQKTPPPLYAGPPLYEGPPPNKEWIYEECSSCVAVDLSEKKKKCNKCNGQGICIVKIPDDKLPWWITRHKINNNI